MSRIVRKGNVCMRLEDLVAGFQTGQLKNPDGTQGPKWNLVKCGKNCAISPACKNCPALLLAKKGPHQYFEDRLLAPTKWLKRKHIYVAPEGDLFHEDIPDLFIYKVFAVMEACWWHRFLLSTKRSDRMARMLNDVRFPMMVYSAGVALLGELYQPRGADWGSNIILGVSAENQEYLEKRAPALLYLPECLNKYLLVAPMLGPIKILEVIKRVVDWCICTGERGRKWCNPRPCDLEWQIDLANQVPDIPFFLSRQHNRRWVAKWLDGTGCRSHREFPHVLAT